jgi:hypothetical protein
MKPIGGFFELEQCLTGSSEFHAEAYGLSFGRASLRFILERLRPESVLVPFYSCRVVWETLDQLHIPYSFYGVNPRLEPEKPLKLSAGQYAIIINYFGLKGKVVDDLVACLGRHVIVDNTQAFFEQGYPRVFSFNSGRKFFGVPDGSYLYSPEPLNLELAQNKTISLLHLTKRAEGDLKAAYAAFQTYENGLNSEIRSMSEYSKRIFARVDYEAVRERRRPNFQMFHEALGRDNLFACESEEDAVPFCYPFAPSEPVDRQRLYARQIFVPTLWPEVADSRSNGFNWERSFSRRLLPLPVDQRYTSEDICTVIKALTE